FHFEDPRLDDAVAWMKRLGVRHLRTGLSWADSFRPGARAWFDRQMEAIADFDVTLTFCFTPEHLGVAPHHTSPPRDLTGFADFCAAMVERYAPAGARPGVNRPRRDPCCREAPAAPASTLRSSESATARAPLSRGSPITGTAAPTTRSG